jgi:acetyl-CoA C-acetyltransferase
MIANAHMHKYGTTPEQLAAVAVKNHHNGSMNPHAQFSMEINVDTVLKAVRVAEPLGLFDCSPVTDGAAALLLCPMEVAKELGKPLVKILGAGAATDTIALHDRADLAAIPVVGRAAQKAYEMAGVKPKDVDFCEVHDCFTIAEIVCTEELGLFERGRGGPAAAEGLTALDGKQPVNPSGGLKSKGHPVGATGCAQLVEVYQQLTGRAGKRQIKSPRLGLAQNMGGSGGSATVHILEVSR